MSRKVMIGGEEKGDWFDAVISWAAKPAAPAARATRAEKPAPAPVQRLPKEEVKKAARAIKTREQLMPTSGPSEPHTVVAPPVHVSETETTEEPPVRTTPSRQLAYHPCGHLSWASPEQDEAARAEGKCCGNAKHQPNWSVRGLHTPVPENQRRTIEKERGGGWPGLCCDPATGLYIGGVGNDCRHHDAGKNRCVVHALVPVRAVAPASEEGGEGEGDTEAPKRVTSPRTRKKEPA